MLTWLRGSVNTGPNVALTKRRILLVVEAERFEAGAVRLHHVAGNVAPRFLAAERGLAHLAEEEARLVIEAREDAPVEHAETAVAQHEEIAGVDIGVERADAQAGEHPRREELAHERRDIDTELGGVLEVVDRLAVEQLHREDAAG